MMMFSLVMTAFMVLGFSTKASAAELTADDYGKYHLKETADYTLTVDSSMTATGSSWIKLTVVADNEGNIVLTYLFISYYTFAHIQDSCDSPNKH